MRRYVGLNIFCAVLTLVFSGASFAAENAGEYRAPITGAKLGPVQSAQPASPTASGQAAATGAFAPSQSAAAGQPTPWPSGGMAPYSSFGSMPGAAAGSAAGSGPNPGSNPGPMYNQNSGASASSPMNSGMNAPAGAAAGGMTGTAAAPQSAPNQSAGPSPAPGYAPGYAPNAAPGYAPYASPGAGWQWQGGAVLSGTGQMENFGEDRGIATQYRDPQTGDIITSVVPPSPPEQQNYGTFFIAPQIYPDGNQWGGNYNGSMPRPGQQYMPPVIWQPGTQQDNNRHRNDDRRHDRRSDNRYNNRPGSQGDSPYDQRGSGRGRDGGEWR